MDTSILDFVSLSPQIALNWTEKRLIWRILIGRSLQYPRQSENQESASVALLMHPSSKHIGILPLKWLANMVASVPKLQSSFGRTGKSVLVFGRTLENQHFYYRPQTKFAKVMFLHLSVSHSVHGGGYLGRYPLGRYTSRAGTPPSRYTPGRYTPRHSACWDTVNKQAVRIPLECILVPKIFS